MARTDTLGHFLTDVADAIREKTGSSEEIVASDFDTAISNIPSGGSADAYFDLEPETISTVNKWGTENFIQDISSLELIIPNTITSISNMFSGYTYKYVPRIIASNITSLNALFINCANLIKADLSGIDVSSCTNFSQIFTSCSKLTEIDLSNFKPTNPNAYYMFTQTFQGCSALTEIDLSTIPSKIRGGFTMTFFGCTSLQKLDLRSINISTSSFSSAFGTTASNSVPYNCLIIVADDTDKTYLNTNYADYTNVMTVAEYENNVE